MAIENLDSKEELARWMRENFEAEPLSMGMVNGLQETVTPGRFTELVLENGWTNFFVGFRTAGYMTLPGNGIGLYGMIASGTSGTRFATLPPAARPQESLQFPASNGSGSGALQVLTNGECLAFTAAAVSNVGFGVTFYPSVT